MQLTARAQEAAPQCRGTELQSQKQQSHIRAHKGHCLRLQPCLGYLRISSTYHGSTHRITACISCIQKQLWCQSLTERHHKFFFYLCTYGLLKTLLSTMQYTSTFPLHHKSQGKRQRRWWKRNQTYYCPGPPKLC